jgi:O-antigen/teichoic acid export membrane protein
MEIDSTINIEIPLKSLKNKVTEMGKHFLIYGAGSAMQGLVTFLLLPLLSKYYSSEDYGIYTLIILVGSLLGLVFYLGAQSSITRFYYEVDSHDYKIQTVTNAMLITIVGAFLCICVGYFGSAIVSKYLFETIRYANLIFLSSIIASLSIINTFLITYLRLIKKSYLFIIVNILNLSVNFFITYIIFEFSFFENILVAPLIGQISGLLISVLLSIFPILKMWKIKNVDFDNIWLQVRFSFPILLNGIIYSLFEWSDRIIIEEKLSMSDVGLYSFGYKLGTIITLLFVVPFGMIFSVLRMEYSKDKNSKDFFSTITTYFTIIGMAGIILITTFSREIVFLSSNSSEYYEAFKIMPFILIGRLLLGYTGIFDFGLYYENKTYHYLWIYGIALFLNIILNFIFLGFFGYQFAAINKVFSYFVLIFVLYLTSDKYFHIPIEKRIVTLSISFAICMIIIQIINIFSYSMLISLVVLLAMGVFWYNHILFAEEKRLIKKIIYNYRI